MSKNFLHVRARVIVPEVGGTVREATRTFWTYQKSIRPDGTISFIECDAHGCNDSAAIEAGNGGVVTIFVCKPSDIVWERPGFLNRRYNELHETKGPSIFQL